jgi:hypothetical protein
MSELLSNLEDSSFLDSSKQDSSKQDPSPSKPDSLPTTVEENKPTLLIKNHKEPQLITLKAVDWNAARLWQRIQNGGDRMFPE